MAKAGSGGDTPGTKLGHRHCPRLAFLDLLWLGSWAPPSGQPRTRRPCFMPEPGLRVTHALLPGPRRPCEESPFPVDPWLWGQPRLRAERQPSEWRKRVSGGGRKPSGLHICPPQAEEPCFLHDPNLRQLERPLASWVCYNRDWKLPTLPEGPLLTSVPTSPAAWRPLEPLTPARFSLATEAAAEAPSCQPRRHRVPQADPRHHPEPKRKGQISSQPNAPVHQQVPGVVGQGTRHRSDTRTTLSSKPV